MPNKVKSEDTPEYNVDMKQKEKEALAIALAGKKAMAQERKENGVIELALEYLETRLCSYPIKLSTPDNVRDYLTLELAQDKTESFCILFLNNKHHLVKFERLFHGTIDGCSVHPRVVVQKALEYNANAVILAHNHPSGNPEPSAADKHLTTRLTDALALIEIQVLDHIIVGNTNTFSFAERGLL